MIKKRKSCTCVICTILILASITILQAGISVVMAFRRVLWLCVIILSLCLIILSQIECNTVYNFYVVGTQPVNALGYRLYVSEELIEPHGDGIKRHIQVKPTMAY